MDSSDVTIFTSCILGILVIVLYWRLTRNRINLPPGPTALPWIGTTWKLSDDWRNDFKHFGKVYGDVFSLYHGSRLTIVLNSYEALHEAFVKQAMVFAGRPPGFGGLFDNFDEKYEKIRKFIVKNLRTHDFGTVEQEAKCREVAQEFLSVCDNHNKDLPLDVCQLTETIMPNLMFRIVLGKSFPQDDEDFELFRKSVRELFKEVLTLHLYTNVPVLQILPRVRQTLKHSEEVMQKQCDFFSEPINQHRENLPTDGVARDMLDTILLEMQDGETFTNYTDQQLKELLHSIIADAVGSTPVMMQWIILYMAKLQWVQNKVQQEIDDVIGSRAPTLADRKCLPYSEAVIMECFRLVSLGPLGVNRMTLQDTALFGYRIPAGTDVIANLWAIHHDPLVWDDTNEFRPERFLKDGAIIHPDAYVPFSRGRRACIGEQSANKEIFFLFVSLFQRYKLRLDRTIDSLKGKFEGFLMWPPEFKVYIEKR